jgi:carbon-monoxide dehydrogenase large subunit
MKEPKHPVLADGKVRYVGDRVALVVAETLDQAKAAAALIEVDYDELPAGGRHADRAAGRAAVHDEAPDNRATTGASATRTAPTRPFKAAHVTTLSFRNNRLIPNAMEPRAPTPATTRRRQLHAVRRQPEPARRAAADVRLRAGHPRAQDARGRARRGRRLRLKIFLYGEETALVWASKQLGRPIKWTCERSEAFLSDAHGRDHVTTAELALDKDGKFLALRVHTTANLGAYLSTFASAVPTILYATLLAGQYATPKIWCEVRRCSPTPRRSTPTAAPAAPRPPTWSSASSRPPRARLGIDPAEIRRRNFIKTSFPYATPVGLTYDTGDYDATMTAPSNWPTWPASRPARPPAKPRA